MLLRFISLQEGIHVRFLLIGNRRFLFLFLSFFLTFSLIIIRLLIFLYLFILLFLQARLVIDLVKNLFNLLSSHLFELFFLFLLFLGIGSFLFSFGLYFLHVFFLTLFYLISCFSFSFHFFFELFFIAFINRHYYNALVFFSLWSSCSFICFRLRSFTLDSFQLILRHIDLRELRVSICANVTVFFFSCAIEIYCACVALHWSHARTTL